LTLYSKPPILDGLYGSNPVSWKIFFRLRPARMKMTQTQNMQGSGHKH